MGWNSHTYGEGHGGNSHKGKVVENKGINPGVRHLCSRRQASSKAIGEDMGVFDLYIQNLQVDDSISQRTPSYRRWVEAWKRWQTLNKVFEEVKGSRAPDSGVGMGERKLDRRGGSGPGRLAV